MGKIPWTRKWQPTPVFLSGKSHGWRSLVGYSPWGRKESDTTEGLQFHFASLLASTIAKASSDKHFALFHFFCFGLSLATASHTILQTSVHSFSCTLSIRSRFIHIDNMLEWIVHTLSSVYIHFQGQLWEEVMTYSTTKLFHFKLMIYL